MASNNGEVSPLGSDEMDEEAFAQYLGGDSEDMTDADSENDDHDTDLEQSPVEPLIDENLAPLIEGMNKKSEPRHPRALPYVIPEGAEIIDVDMLDDDSFTFASDIPCPIRVKEEPVKTVMTDIQKHTQATPNDDELLGNPPTPGIPSLEDEQQDPSHAEESVHIIPAGNPPNPTVQSTDDTDDVEIKEEEGENRSVEFVWAMGMPKEQIVISDDEEDVAAIRAILTPGKGSPDVMEPVTSNSVPSTRKFLITKKPRPPLTDEEKTKLTEMQAKLAARATGKLITGGAGSVFRGLEVGHQPGAQPIGPTGLTVPAEPADPHAWMHEEVELDEDDAAEKFEALKKKYKAKKRSGKADFVDEINFTKAEKAERARLKRLEDDFLRALETQAEPAMGDGDENNDDLFIPLADQSQTQQKRRRNTTVEDLSGKDGDAGGPTSKRAKPAPSQKKLHTQILDQGMLAALDTEIGKKKMDEKKAKANAKGSGEKKKPSKRKPKSGPKANETSGEKPKGTKKLKAKGPKGKGKQPNLLDVNSLLNSNVYADANASLEIARLPPMTEKKKKDALKQLIASVPLEDQRMANRERVYIKQATIDLAKHQVKADGKGGWALKGMKSSLKHHQVQGAAWMRVRENGTDEPLGGLVGDEMGFGKTIQMLACMVANPPPLDSPHKATLIVVPSAICAQWHDEIRNHVDQKVLGSVIRYHNMSRLLGDGAVELLQSAGVILTTYSEVLRSYPKYKPPKELMTYEKRRDWWRDHFDKHRGLLHRISFYRVVLDEAQAIKNHLAQTSIACRGLVTKRRWAMSGTPIHNSPQELYPYFKFLHVKHTGTFEVFKENFCDKNSGVSNERLHSFLRQFMIRRTHKDRLFGAPLISLPKNNERTIYLDFNEAERAIYEIIRHRYIKRINEFKNSGVLEKSYSNVLTMLLRLRQLTAHIFLLQETMEDLFELEDVERLWKGTAAELESAGSEKDVTGKNMLVQIRKMIADKDKPKDDQQAATPASPDPSEDDASLEKSQPLVFKFRKFLRDLAEGSKWDKLTLRSLCHKCRDVPQDPQVTNCLHIYCKECLKTMAYEAAQEGEDHAACLECGIVYSETRPCSGLKELGYDDGVARSESGTPTSSRRPRRDPDEDIKWVSMEGGILPSTKSTATVAQIEQWLKEDSKCKIIIFTQWHLMIKILSRICTSRGWNHRMYHGKMTPEAREKMICEFREVDDVQILVASLKCGGVGLNLTCASRVINIDLFWNSSVEMQAFCRVFRIGQEKETFITRFVIRNTVDEKLQALQEDKKERIDAAIGDDGKREAKLSLQELLRLFGPVQDDEGKEFILVDDEDEYADTMPTIANEHEDNAYVPPPNM